MQSNVEVYMTVIPTYILSHIQHPTNVHPPKMPTIFPHSSNEMRKGFWIILTARECLEY